MIIESLTLITDLHYRIEDAHRSLLEPTPKIVSPVAAMDRLSGQTSCSPVTSKSKRRQTTEGAFGHEKKKVVKTYRSKTTLDDLSRHRADLQEGWDVPKTKKRKLDDDEVDTIALSTSKTVKKGRVLTKYDRTDGKNASSQNDSEVGKSAFGTQSSLQSIDDLATQELSINRRMSGSRSMPSTTSQISQYDQNDQEQSRRNVAPLNNVHAILDTHDVGHELLPTVTSPAIDQEPTATTSTHMLPPDMKQSPGIQIDYQYSDGSTIPNTPAELPDAASNPSVHIGHNSDRMTTPTASSKSVNDTQDKYKLGENGPNMQPPELDQGVVKPRSLENAFNSSEFTATRLDIVGVDGGADGSMTEPLTQNSAEYVIDELSLPIPKMKDLSRNQKSTMNSQRKANDSDDFRSDVADLSFPKEQYQPRPSRSRSNRDVDNLVQAIDYSKRPEAALKAKNKLKRRKTTSDFTMSSHDVVDEGTLGGAGLLLQSNVWDTEPSVVHGGPPPVAVLDDVAEYKPFEAENITEDAQEPSAEVTEPKKKRGRPKKEVVADLDEDNAHETPEEPVQRAEVMVEGKEAAPAQPAKRGRKRKKTEEVLSLLTAEPVTEDTVASTNHDESRAIDHTSPTTMLSEAKAKANKTDQALPKEATPVPIQTPPAPLQTPQKPGKKGPDKHSPLNSGKVAYRVGLSKNARIAPLLRGLRR